MAQRYIFVSGDEKDRLFYYERLIDFTYFSGFAVSQKQKSIRSLHENAVETDPSLKILEVSTKSEDPLGRELSAFNLMFHDIDGRQYHLENVFQASKVYENGGPFQDLLNVSPAEAKRDPRHKEHGPLKMFKLNDWECALEPKTMFYDWIYCKALSQNGQLVDQLILSGFNAFTDIEFNHKRSINCQARSAAIFLGLLRKDKLREYLADKEKWKSIY